VKSNGAVDLLVQHQEIYLGRRSGEAFKLNILRNHLMGKIEAL
jgi:hypothetical protein